MNRRTTSYAYFTWEGEGVLLEVSLLAMLPTYSYTCKRTLCPRPSSVLHAEVSVDDPFSIQLLFAMSLLNEDSNETGFVVMLHVNHGGTASTMQWNLLSSQKVAQFDRILPPRRCKVPLSSSTGFRHDKAPIIIDWTRKWRESE